MQWLKIAVAAACGVLAGCSQAFMAERIVAAPNGAFQSSRPAASAAPAARDRKGSGLLSLTVGPPEATLAVWVRQPAGSPRGTVLLLHGILNDHHQLDGIAAALVRAGYITAQVDLRGHGQSTGKHISFGVFDARDLAQVITELQARHLCGETIGVYGTSYGAASAILLAGSDPRVKAIVAVAPFATLREEAPHFGRHILPLPGALLSDAEYVSIIDAAGKIAGFDPDEASPLAAIGKTGARVLLIHGFDDAITPVEASQKLHAAAPEKSELMLLKGEGHLGLSFDLFGDLHPVAQGWFDRFLATERKATP
jgi:pimeloyl-ACP methyl ester carboxylesterase